MKHLWLIILALFIGCGGDWEGDDDDVTEEEVEELIEENKSSEKAAEDTRMILCLSHVRVVSWSTSVVKKSDPSLHCDQTCSTMNILKDEEEGMCIIGLSSELRIWDCNESNTDDVTHCCCQVINNR